MKLLLDTQALLWWLSDSPQLGTVARKVIADGGCWGMGDKTGFAPWRIFIFPQAVKM